jgi:hypothetical protein
MAEPVHSYMPAIEATAAQTRVTGSASRFASPAVVGTNHVLGYRLSGLLHLQTRYTAVDGVEGVFRVMAQRHPNCDYLLAWFWVDTITQDSPTVTVTAGTGTPQAATPVDRTGGAELLVFAPWGASDSGWQEVTYDADGCTIGGAMIVCCPRATLGTGDTYVAEHHSSHRAAGFGPNECLIHDSGTQDVRSLAAAITSAKVALKPMAFSWTSPDDFKTVTGKDPTTIWDVTMSPELHPLHRAPSWKSGDSDQGYRCYLRTRMGGTASSYAWQVTTSKGTYTKAGLTRVSFGWDYVEPEVDCTGDDDFKIEAYTDDAAGTVDIEAVSIGLA